MFRGYSKGPVTFKSLCHILAKIILAKHKEVVEFIFNMFDTDNDRILNSKEFETFLKTCPKAIK